MAYGRPAVVRSHRRSGKRRKKVSRTLRVVVITVLALAGLVVGYTQLLARTCSGEETVRVLASSATANHLSAFATDWGRQEPATSDGTCARVVVQSRDSAEAAAQLGTGWEVADEDPPHVWVPSATVWANRAAASEGGQPIIPELLPSIARTPAVIAMPEPVAAALEWPQTRLDGDTEVRWASLLGDFDGSGFDGSEFRFGMANPARDTAALLTLTAVLDRGDDGEASAEELESTYALSRLLEPEVYHETTEQLLIGLAEQDQVGADAALRHVSAFPALEQAVLAYNRGNPEVPLSAVYPVDGTVEADHPYLILNGEWVSDRQREVAQGFLDYVRSAGPQSVLMEAGFRGLNREAGPDLVEQNGVQPELAALPRTLLAPESVSRAIDRWMALTSRLNVLMVIDVSAAMLAEVPGTGELLLDRAKEGTTELVELFSDDDQLGLWGFATALDGDLDHRSLVPIGQVDDTMDDGRIRREHVLGAIQDLAAGGDTGLYNTIQAAYDTVLANYEQDGINLVVVVTAGPDSTGERPSIGLEQLLAHLRDAPSNGEQVRVATVGLGEQVDTESLQQISDVTGAESRYSADGLDLADALRSAVFVGTP